MSTPSDDDRRPEQPDLPAMPALVVGLGASAGGISALSSFFTHAPPEAPFAYVVILHLSPDHDSELADILQSSTSLPVTQVHETVRLQPRHVYVIPPNQNLRVADGGDLTLLPMTRVEERRAPVDVFFRTLADHYGSRAAAVVLSGTGPNGSNGLKRVKERGGLTIAQNPGEAQHGDMPSNAIATGLVDYVLSLVDMPDRIVQYHERLTTGGIPLGEDHLVVDDSEALRDVMSLVRARTAHDFTSYKQATIRRRIARRMNLLALSSVADYARLMREQPEEAVLLMRELLISVTHFFRDGPIFDALEQHVIPRLFAGKTAFDQMRVWSAGCATGEEAYSIGMLLVEHASTLFEPPIIQVFATDLDEQAVAIAREGLYSEGDIADVTPERLQRFFQRDASGYRVRRELREQVLFAQHNLIKDPPFSHVDLISCRNLLIYLNRPVQQRLLETFHFALRPGGYLILGTSESADGASELFMPVDKVSHVFESRPVGARLPLATIDRHVPRAPTAFSRMEDVRPADRLSAGDLHLRLLEQFAPPSLIVTEEHTVVHVSESGGRFLRVGGGEPSRDVLKLVHRDLCVDLRTALHLATQQRSPVEVQGVRFSAPGGDLLIRIAVKPVLREGAPARGYFVVTFEEEGAPPQGADSTELTSPTAPHSPHLDEELARVKAQLRVTIEQYETQAEEGKATNEELQAMNEELRSSTEELETSKEELQSVNQELTTVNQELKIKIEELRLTNNDLQNLINSTEIGAIFLDKALRVKLATPRAREVFNLLPADVGRKLSDITSHLNYPELYQDVEGVLARLRPVEREATTRDGRWFYLHVVPYRTVDDRIDGVAITFQDITRRRSAEGQVKTGEERMRLLIDRAIDYAIFTMTPNGCIDYWNSGAERMFGYRAEEIIGLEGAVLFTPEDRAAGIPREELERAAHHGRDENERWHIRRSGDRFYVSGVTMRLGDGEHLGFAKIARDLSDQQHADAALGTVRAELEGRVKQRTAELETAVAQHATARQDVTALLHRIVTAQEDERARMARDLHDQLGQQLTALRLALERHGAKCASDGHELDRALALTREIDGQLDFLAWELRPAILDDLGLAAALPRFLEEWSAHYGIASHFATAGDIAGAVSREAEVTVYRIAQEALNNIVKHAHASRVDVLLERRDGSVVMVIEDDGVGFDPDDVRTVERGIGLAGMRERAVLIDGTLQVESQPGDGTTVFLRCPSAHAEGERSA